MGRWGDQPGFFDVDERLKWLSNLGDHLEAVSFAVDLEMFRADLVAALGYSGGAQGGRPPFDPVMMSRSILVMPCARRQRSERRRARSRRSSGLSAYSG